MFFHPTQVPLKVISFFLKSPKRAVIGFFQPQFYCQSFSKIDGSCTPLAEALLCNTGYLSIISTHIRDSLHPNTTIYISNPKNLRFSSIRCPISLGPQLLHLLKHMLTWSDIFFSKIVSFFSMTLQMFIRTTYIKNYKNKHVLATI